MVLPSKYRQSKTLVPDVNHCQLFSPFCHGIRLASHCASPKWWQLPGWGTKSVARLRKLRHSTATWRIVIHPGFCRRRSHRAAPKWWICCYLWQCFLGTLQHSTIGARSALHTGLCGRKSYSASAQRWPCSCLWEKLWGTMQHSTFGWRNVLHPGLCRRVQYDASSQWWCCCALPVRQAMEDPCFGSWPYTQMSTTMYP